MAGDGQTGTVGQPLGDSLVVRVTDPEDRPVAGVEVEFVAPAGAVVAPNDTVLTDENGRAAVHYTLATSAGEQMVHARAAPVVPLPSLNTVFRETALPEAATTLLADGGNGQIGETGTVLSDSLAVKAVDRFGNGVPGVEVLWEASGGSVSPATDTTGSDGRAATERILGDRPGPHITTASAGGLEGSPVSFAATAVGPHLIIVTQPSSSASAGVPLSTQPVLQLQSAAGIPLHRADVAVTVQIASGDGSLGGGLTARSDGQGVVAFEDLSIRGAPGVRTLIFAASDFTSAISSEIDVGPGPPQPGAGSVSVPASGTAGSPTTITVRLEDAFGTAVDGAADDIAIAVTGANQASEVEVNDRGDGSYSGSYTPTVTGTDRVEVRVSGEVVPGSPFTTTVVAGPADPSTTTAAVFRSGIFGSTINVVVTTRDAGGNLLRRGGDLVQVRASSGDTWDVPHQGDGTYRATFVGVFATVTFDILLNGVPIAGSPFTI